MKKEGLKLCSELKLQYQVKRLKTLKREVRCFKCGQKGHIAPNCRKQKLNALSDEEEEYYSENNTLSSETDKSQTKSTITEKQIEKIANCLCQINMLTADQELFIEMIDQIEDKETKEKYIRKIIEHQNTKPKYRNNLANSYKV